MYLLRRIMKRLLITTMICLTFLQIEGHNLNSDTYKHPFGFGDLKWNSYKTVQDRKIALQIPLVIIESITTRNLLEVCLDYPYLIDFESFNDQDTGFAALLSEFNGFGELMKRDDLTDVLLEYFEKIPQDTEMLKNYSSLELGDYSFKRYFLTYLLSRQDVQSRLSYDSKQRLLSATSQNAKLIADNDQLFGTPLKSIIKQLQSNRSLSATYFYVNNTTYLLTTRQTPRGRTVVAGTLSDSDFDMITKLSLKNSVEQAYGVTVVSEATKTYNCHAYAFHLSQGHPNDYIWIGPTSTDEDIYWLDGSYYEVPAAKATIVSYTGQHSAVRLSNGHYLSKWGNLPLVEHDSLNVPNGIQLIPNVVTENYGIPEKFLKRYTPKLMGPALISTSATYYVDPLPYGYSVTWSLADSYYSQNCIQTNYPTITISRASGKDLNGAVLTATIYCNGYYVTSLTKTIYAYAGFRGYYTSGNLSGNINYTYTFNIKANATTYITSPNFYGATVTYGSSGLTPSIWTFSPTYGDLTMVAPASPPGTTIPVVINVHDSCGNDYVLYAFPSSSYSINVSNGDSGIIVRLHEDGNASKDFTPDESWNIEIANATSGRIMATRSSTNCSETISTAGWPKGIYIVKATIGKEELTEKVIVK